MVPPELNLLVLDNDAPENISIVASEPQITEGDSVKFEIWSHQTFSYDRPINFETTDENNILSTNLPESVVIKAGERVGTLELATTDNNYNNESASITVTLLDGHYYDLAESSTSASVVVEDNDNFVISITETEDIEEGDDAIFVITSAQIPTENLIVMVEINATGDFFSAEFI